MIQCVWNSNFNFQKSTLSNSFELPLATWCNKASYHISDVVGELFVHPAEPQDQVLFRASQIVSQKPLIAMPSRSASRGRERTRSRTPLSVDSRSRSPSRPRRSISPRSPSPRRNGNRRTRSPSPMKSTKVASSLLHIVLN